MADQRPAEISPEHSTVPYEDQQGHHDVKDVKDEKALAGGAGDGEIFVQAAHDEDIKGVTHDLGITGEDALDLEQKLDMMTLDRCFTIIKQVRELHLHDQNFPGAVLAKIDEFLFNPDVADRPEKHPELVRDIKMECLLVTENSPYAEVRANADNWDDVNMPSFTFRVWVLGIVLSGAGAFINQFFSIRQPPVLVTANVAQLIAYPLGRGMAAILPDAGFTIRGKRHSLNPGPFNKKEHMLITIMANVAFNTPYTGYTVFVQALPQYFNQPYAYGFGYQLLSSLGTNFVGYGIAGLCRRFLVFPSFCIWPASLVTLALLKAFHTETNEPVPGPFKRMYTWSREKFFLIAFFSMFFYWWFPGFIFTALSYFSWITWIAPNNVNLDVISGINYGLGLNPWPTFDFNVLMAQGWVPLVLPTFTVVNLFLGMVVSFFMIVAWYYTNSWDTGYLLVNSNRTFDNTGNLYNVSQVLDAHGNLDPDLYQQYSMPYMTAGNLCSYFWFFACYSSTVSYAYLYHRHEISLGFRSLWRSIKKRRDKVDEDDDLAEDIHFQLMKSYPEVPEWWYMLVLGLAILVGMLGVGLWPTNTSPVVVVYGLVMALISVVPTGIIASVTGIQVTMNVLAEFIGGAMVSGNAIALNYFKMYGYITTAQAIYFSNDLKLAHYTKIPPRYTFSAQLIATLVSTFICTALFNFQMSFNAVCTENADFQFSCPGQNTFFTAAVFWGTLSPKRLFGPGRRYNMLLLGFPVGFLMPIGMYAAQKAFPKQQWIRQLHPVMIATGGIYWSPYNFANTWPAVPLTMFSWLYIKRRYLGFWSKYNYVLAAAWSAGIAVAAIVIFFALEIPHGGIELDWWGNSVTGNGCEGSGECIRLPIPDVGYFGPAPGTNSFT